MPAFREMEARESLDHFHQRCVVPEKDETASRNEEIDAFVRFLQAKFQNPPHTPARVLKGGSLGKGTAVRGLADIDLVVILNGLSSISDLESHRPSLLNKLEREVSGYSWKRGIQKQGRTPYALQYILNGQKLDVLPAFDIYSAYGTKEAVYREMKGREIELAMQVSASLAPLQIEFVKSQDEAVKRVIRLLKLWNKEREVGMRSCTLELLTIHASRKSGGWSTDSLFRDVLELLANCRTLKVAFNTNYNSGGYTGRFRAPYVLDPANPYMNTMYGNDPNTISAEARSMLSRL